MFPSSPRSLVTGCRAVCAPILRYSFGKPLAIHCRSMRIPFDPIPLQQGSWPPVIIWWERLKVSEASAKDFPFTTDVILDADVLAMAAPSPRGYGRGTPSTAAGNSDGQPVGHPGGISVEITVHAAHSLHPAGPDGVVRLTPTRQRSAGEAEHVEPFGVETSVEENVPRLQFGSQRPRSTLGSGRGKV